MEWHDRAIPKERYDTFVGVMERIGFAKKSKWLEHEAWCRDSWHGHFKGAG